MNAYESSLCPCPVIIRTHNFLIYASKSEKKSVLFIDIAAMVGGIFEFIILNQDT